MSRQRTQFEIPQAGCATFKKKSHIYAPHTNLIACDEGAFVATGRIRMAEREVARCTADAKHRGALASSEPRLRPSAKHVGPRPNPSGCATLHF